MQILTLVRIFVLTLVSAYRLPQSCQTIFLQYNYIN
jgi:hypothetical protein